MRNKNKDHAHSRETTALAILLPAALLIFVGLGQGSDNLKDGTPPRGGTDIELSWRTIDAGGEMFSTGGNFELSGTIGQPDSGMLSDGRFELSGGFWFPIPPGDCNADGGVDLLDYGEVAVCLSGPDGELPLPDCNCYDLDGDGDVDLSDVARFQVEFTGG